MHWEIRDCLMAARVAEFGPWSKLPQGQMQIIMPRQSSWQICLPGEWPQIQMGWVIRALGLYSPICMRQGDIAASSIYRVQAHPTPPIHMCFQAYSHLGVDLSTLHDVLVPSKRSILLCCCCSKLLSSEWKLKSKFLEEVSIVLPLIYFKRRQNLDIPWR